MSVSIVVSLWQHTVSVQQYQQSTVLRQYVTQYQQSTGGSRERQCREREREPSVSRESITESVLSTETTQLTERERVSRVNGYTESTVMLKIVQPFHLSDILHREDQCDVSTALQLHNKRALLRYSSSDTQVRYIITLWSYPKWISCHIISYDIHSI